jgi:hypothetical protein
MERKRQSVAALATSIAMVAVTGCSGRMTSVGVAQSAISSSHQAAYVFDPGISALGISDPNGPPFNFPGASIFTNAINGTPLPNGGVYNGVTFTNVSIGDLDTNPATGLSGFDTAVLYQICGIGGHPAAMSAINAFLDAGNKVMIFDADACANGVRGQPDWSGFRFPFATSNPGPRGAEGSYTEVEPSSLTTGLAVGPQEGDSVGDANIFTSNAGGWCKSIKATNTLGANGFVEAYARTVSGGLAIYEGEDFWFSFQPTAHLKHVFDLMLAQQFAPDGLPCTIPASGIKLDPLSQNQNVGSPATVTATVTDSDGNGLPNVTVNFAVFAGVDVGITGSAVTDAGGHATFTYVNTTGVGTDSLHASFSDGTGTHESNQVVVNWIAQPTSLAYVGATSNDFDDPVTLAAVLSTLSGPVAGQTVTFTLGGQTCTGTTDAAGKAACTMILNLPAGAYTVVASFAGAGPLLPSSVSAPFSVSLEETTLHYTGDTVIANGSSATLAGQLSEDGVTPIAGRTVTFTLGTGGTAQSCTGTTDASGHAACAVVANQPLGPGVVTASFAGDGFYRPATASANIILFQFLASGSFVVGDQSAAIGSAVTFWGAQWSKRNSLSGGGAPPSFKGFADDVSTKPPACGDTWSARPGNSSAPPDSVPLYMGVIVSSSISKSGAAISGDAPSLVIVKTDDGYEPNPGHAGTGTVIATICH